MQGQVCAPIYLYGENVKKSFSQNVLKTMAEIYKEWLK